MPTEPLRGTPGGPLDGLTFSVKDLYGVPGWPLRASTRAPVPPVGESVLVRRLLELGATALGKTHLHEIALGITGGGRVRRHRAPGPGGPRAGRQQQRRGRQRGAGAGRLRAGHRHRGQRPRAGGVVRCGGLQADQGPPRLEHRGRAPPLGDLRPRRAAGARRGDRGARARGPERRDGHPPGLGGRARRRVAAGGLDRRGGARGRGGLRGRAGGARRPPLPRRAARDARRLLAHRAQRGRAGPRPGLAGEGPRLPALHAHVAAAGSGAGGGGGRGGLRPARRLPRGAGRPAGAVRRAAGPAVPTPPPLAGQDEVEVGSGTMPLRRAVLRLTTPFSLLGAPTLALPTAAPWIGAQLVGRHGDDARLLGLALTLEDSR
ncbi:Amidase, putative [Deinococcus gobiensis I-0]|uniref:Amidase, putative n=1 Tax=Deinococcus gobiensis (strain DSM 21396 / JCM 16679 / CGMCC 1.7299 / I-0) TaxID=745776 RepID=H8GV18_DEIGI|nr:Amidase, putative [Deinococcus gobiensis I-0]